VQLIATTTVDFLFSVCTVHLESCRFARNSIKIWRFVVLTLSRTVWKIKQSTEIRSQSSGLRLELNVEYFEAWDFSCLCLKC